MAMALLVRKRNIAHVLVVILLLQLLLLIMMIILILILIPEVIGGGAARFRPSFLFNVSLMLNVFSMATVEFRKVCALTETIPASLVTATRANPSLNRYIDIPAFDSRYIVYIYTYIYIYI